MNSRSKEPKIDDEVLRKIWKNQSAQFKNSGFRGPVGLRGKRKLLKNNPQLTRALDFLQIQHDLIVPISQIRRVLRSIPEYSFTTAVKKPRKRRTYLSVRSYFQLTQLDIGTLFEYNGKKYFVNLTGKNRVKLTHGSEMKKM